MAPKKYTKLLRFAMTMLSRNGDRKTGVSLRRPRPSASRNPVHTAKRAWSADLCANQNPRQRRAAPRLRGCRKSNVIPANAGIWNRTDGCPIADLDHAGLAETPWNPRLRITFALDPIPDSRFRG